MPLYDYCCTACNSTSELLIRADSTPSCPLCGSEALEKLLSIPTPPSQSKAKVKSARAQAAREGHFSNYQRD